MFTLTGKAVTPPITGACFPEPSANHSIVDYVGNFKCTDITTSATVGSMIYTIARCASDTNITHVVNNCKRMFANACHVAVVNLVDTPAANSPADVTSLIAAIKLNEPSARHWIVNLVNAAKKKPLTGDNVDGFFASMMHTGTKGSAVASFINTISAFFPDSISDATFRANLADGMWTEYRITRVSTGKVIITVMNELKELRIMSTADEAAVNASANAPWDITLSSRISKKVVGYACLFLQAAGTPIENWYQGNKAVDELPVSKIRALKMVFKKYIDLKNNVDNVESIKSLQQLLADDNVKALLS